MRSLVIAAALIAAGMGPAVAAGTWMTDSQSGCTVWDPQPVPDQTIRWTGDCKDGKASGAGTLTVFRAEKPVERNEGQFVEGKQTGHGVRHYLDGHYTGRFKDGLFDGDGVYIASNGMRYDGEWKAGNFDGHGTLSFVSGVRYEGQFRANTFNGYGSLALPNGARYDGEYRLNTPHGTGVYTDVSGATFAGQWSDGCFRDGNRTAHLGVFAEDCGLSADASVARAPGESLDSAQN